ncbi:hypothetical protein V8Z80_18495 [Orrella sp. JC864]|uniref:hypothetical protein n=1 Tax=Orrella sp. JC864 TaxID=3120298 RepID=UPI00300A89FF
MKKLTPIVIVSSALLGAASVHAAGLDRPAGGGQLLAQAGTTTVPDTASPVTPGTGPQEGTQSRGNLDYQPGGTGSPNMNTREEVTQDRDAARATGDMQQKGELTQLNQREQTTSQTREEVSAERDAAQATGQTSRGNLDYPKKTN